MKADDVSHVDILYAPESAAIPLSDLRAVRTDNPDKPYRIDVKGHVRNREGYKSRLMLDIAALRKNGCILEYVPTDSVKAEINAGKRDPKTFQLVSPSKANAPTRGKQTTAA